MPTFPESTVDSKRKRSTSPSGGSPRPGVLALLAVALLVVLAVPVFGGRRLPAVGQPIAFNHKKHTVDLQLDCSFCHKYYNTSAHSGLPDAQTCGMCHSVKLGDTEEAAKLTDILQAEEPLEFNKLFRMPDYVFYTHRRHVGVGGLECANCHADIAETERPPERPLIEIKMAFCVDCHEEREVSTDCTSCHR